MTEPQPQPATTHSSFTMTCPNGHVIYGDVHYATKAPFAPGGCGQCGATYTLLETKEHGIVAAFDDEPPAP